MMLFELVLFEHVSDGKGKGRPEGPSFEPPRENQQSRPSLETSITRGADYPERGSWRHLECKATTLTRQKIDTGRKRAALAYSNTEKSEKKTGAPHYTHTTHRHTCPRNGMLLRLSRAVVSSTERHSTKAKFPDTLAWMMGLPSFCANPTWFGICRRRGVGESSQQQDANKT